LKKVGGCGAPLRDCAVDWDTPLPEDKFARADLEIQKADRVICLGTSLRIRPAGNKPAAVLKKKKEKKVREEKDKKRKRTAMKMDNEVSRSGKLVIVNLQKTHLDQKASLVVHAKCDDVMVGLCSLLGVEIPNAVSSSSSSSNATTSESTEIENSVTFTESKSALSSISESSDMKRRLRHRKL